MIILHSKNLRIVSFTQKHLTHRYVSWLNNKKIVKYSELRHKKQTLKACKKYMQNIIKTGNSLLAIEDKETKKHIGNITLIRDYPNKNVDIAILIGEMTMQGKGLGFEAWMSVLKYLKKDPRFKKITAGTMACNKKMVRIMHKSGMIFDGIRKRYLLVDKKETDLLFASLRKK